MEIVFYKTRTGSEPAREFILGLGIKVQAKVVRTIKLLADNGPALREPYSKPLGDGIFELRIQLATDAVRVLYFFWVGDRAVLTNGFTKKTPKTPAEAIERAKTYRQDFLQRQVPNDKI